MKKGFINKFVLDNKHFHNNSISIMNKVTILISSIIYIKYTYIFLLKNIKNKKIFQLR